ncbi:MAG: NADH:ubiquinone oxidoreductase subunit C [Halobacteriales archaeon]|jgi:NADH:ubiquinone oxidoreductase subunit C
MDADELKETIEDDVGDMIAETMRGRPRRVEVILEDPDRIVDIMEYLTDEGIVHLSTITGRDDGADVELLYHMLRYGEESGEGDLDEAILVTVRTFVSKGAATIESITDAVPGANLYEREIMDMFGVEFDGHPNPDELLLPDDWEEDEAPPLLKEDPAEMEGDD